ncbi:hypothetical protein [Lewinella sp. 4G2]|uniref:hypothetical protein n=1 Tax=Lewinella sp. 4G2 TaxID=1803372 RepID=UPI0007B4B10A|nr:hypothetical protein [Lewinella sp. 4G2]OAV43608.1 hypothetical protein A3850_003450 [Lewinella sp. 4G2]
MHCIKNTLTIICALVAFLLLAPLHGQDCPTGIIRFTSQAEIDQFLIDFPTCTELDGIDIRPTSPGSSEIDVTNLEGLSNISIVNGELSVNAKNLTGFTGLRNLTRVGGSFGLYGFGFPSYTSLEGLENLSFIGGDLNLNSSGASRLETLAGLENLQTLNGTLRISSDRLREISALSQLSEVGGLQLSFLDELVSLEGLHNITRVNGNVSIAIGRKLIGLNGLRGLTVVDGDFRLNNLALVTSLSGLENLSSIAGKLTIDFLVQIEDLDELSALNVLGGDLTITRNSQLGSISALEKLNLNSISLIRIEDNPNLEECAIASVCSYLSTDGSSILLENNGQGCNTRQELDDACASLNRVYIGNVPYRTITDAFDAAQDGDEIIVTSGAYNENINLQGKSITIKIGVAPE